MTSIVEDTSTQPPEPTTNAAAEAAAATRLRLTDVMDDDILALDDPLDRIAATLRRRDRKYAEAEMLTRLAGQFAQAMHKKGMTAVDISRALKARGIEKASEATVRRLLGLASGRKRVPEPAATGLRPEQWTDAT